MAEEKLRLEDLLGNVQRNDVQEKIEYVAIIGAGIMGQGIAQSIAGAGIDVLMVEKDQGHLDKALENLKGSMEREIARWGITQSEMKAIMDY